MNINFNDDTIYTSTYILTWNPKVFRNEEYYLLCKEGQKHGIISGNWSCRSKQPKEGDRYVMLMQGMGERNGIVGYGLITSEPCELPGEGFGGRFIDIEEYGIFDYQKDEQIKTSLLKERFPEQCWVPQGSGIRIKSSVLPDLWWMIMKRKNGL